jgi:hypothetical protein
MLGDVGAAIESGGVGACRRHAAFCGHRIGRVMHDTPLVRLTAVPAPVSSLSRAGYLPPSRCSTPAAIT